MSAAERDFERVLPRLVNAYRKGRLVPFIGGGLSAPVCASWAALVGGLEREARITLDAPSEETPSQELIRRANRAVRRLRGANPARFPERVRRALRTDGETGPCEPPPQTRALSRLWWPLVLSTNYDDLFLGAFEDEHGPGQLDVLGRSPSDCQRILDALYSPSTALLWTLQGFIGGIRGGDAIEREHRLAGELVVGHEEYRRATHREPHFRRAFGEVFRARSFLFVGSGLKEGYVLELLGEVLELLGASANPNFALVQRGEVDPDFLYARFETTVVEYDDHAEVPGLLGHLADAVDAESARLVRWTYRSAANRDGGPDVEIVRGRLPRPGEGECAALSAGGGSTMAFLGRGSRAFLEEVGVPNRGALHVGWPDGTPPTSEAFAIARAAQPAPGVERAGWLVARVPSAPVYVVRARTDQDEYALDLIVNAFEDLLAAAVADGFHVVHTTLIASGGRETSRATSRSDYHQRPYPAYYALIQMLRTYATWRVANPDPDLRVIVYVVDRSVSFELESGRLDVADLLAADARLRFWTEARVPGASLDRRVLHVPESTPVGAVADALDLPLDNWLVDVVPLPRLGGAVVHRIEKVRDRPIARLDVVPGATLRFRPALAE